MCIRARPTCTCVYARSSPHARWSRFLLLLIGLPRLFLLSHWLIVVPTALPLIMYLPSMQEVLVRCYDDRPHVCIRASLVWSLLPCCICPSLPLLKIKSCSLCLLLGGLFARSCSSWLLLRFPLCFHQVNRYSHFNFPLTSFSSRLFRSLLVPLWPRSLFFSVFLSRPAITRPLSSSFCSCFSRFLCFRPFRFYHFILLSMPLLWSPGLLSLSSFSRTLSLALRSRALPNPFLPLSFSS